jgi:hypothetical protein
MVGVLPETTGGMMFETSIGGKKEDCDFAIGQSRCQPILLAREFIVSNFIRVYPSRNCLPERWIQSPGAGDAEATEANRPSVLM